MLDRYAHGGARQDLLVCFLPPLVDGATRDRGEMEALRERADVVEVPWPPTTTERTPASALTAMRVAMNQECRARIVFGGKLSGYAGTVPGALEEVALALRTPDQPVYLLGGSGGVARAIYEVVEGRPTPALLTFEGQVRANPGNLTLAEGIPKNFYEDLVAELKALGVQKFAERNGLDIEANGRLAETASAVEVADLVARGLATRVRPARTLVDDEQRPETNSR